ncbi:MAG: hypothetical protein EOO89_00265 [Pedobacter sp.]|nr:MAG: hypothetical protein EOO89_00265 [Pedobacter sp.]
MIQIGKTIKELDKLAKHHQATIEKEIGLADLLEARIQGLTDPNEHLFYSTIKINLSEILTGHPDKLQTIIGQINPLYQNILRDRYANHPTNPHVSDSNKKTIRKNLANEVMGIFNYGKFTSKTDGKLAYQHSNNLGVTVCLYCNVSYTFTIQTSRGKARPQFDHFFNKAKFPYLALSFYNLIPSCYSCNASLKGDKEFNMNTHIHPFVEGFDRTTVFITGVKQVEYLLGKSGFDISFHAPFNDLKSKRIKNNCDVFHILESHKFQAEYAGEIIRKAYFYSDSRVKELYREFKIENTDQHIFGSEAEIIEMVFGNHVSDDKLPNRVLSKLTRDILEELKIIKPSV